MLWGSYHLNLFMPGVFMLSGSMILLGKNTYGGIRPEFMRYLKHFVAIWYLSKFCY